MIYHFKTKSIKKKETLEKDMYLSADNEKAFYRRARDQYALTPDEITILEEIEDETINIDTDIFKKPKNNITKIVDTPDEQVLLAKEMLSGDIRGLNESKIQDRINKGYIRYNLIDPENEIKTALNKYKTVKLYYLKDGSKKNKKYLILCK